MNFITVKKHIAVIVFLIVFEMSCSLVMLAEDQRPFNGDTLEIPKNLFRYLNSKLLYINSREAVGMVTIVKPKGIKSEVISDHVRISSFANEKGLEYTAVTMSSPSRELTEKNDDFDSVTIVIMVCQKDGAEINQELSISVSAFGYQQIIKAMKK